jgi:hypothetical protein
MTFRSRLAGLAAGALALPVVALLAVPAVAAEAQTTCSSSQATVTFQDGSSTCQGLGLQLYTGTPAGPIIEVCAGSGALAVPLALGQASLAPVTPGTCASYSSGALELPDAVLVVPGVGLAGLPPGL